MNRSGYIQDYGRGMPYNETVINEVRPRRSILKTILWVIVIIIIIYIVIKILNNILRKRCSVNEDTLLGLDSLKNDEPSCKFQKNIDYIGNSDKRLIAYISKKINDPKPPRYAYNKYTGQLVDNKDDSVVGPIKFFKEQLGTGSLTNFDFSYDVRKE